MPVLNKTKSIYIIWFDYYTKLDKTHKYTLGKKINNLFIEIIEAISTASFLDPAKKLPYVVHAIKKTDVLKILLMILWETKSLDTKKYIALSIKIDEVGKMLGGWNGQLVKLLSSKENSPGKKPREK